MRNRLNFVQTS